VRISITVNGTQCAVDVDPGDVLLDVLRSAATLRSRVRAMRAIVEPARSWWMVIL